MAFMQQQISGPGMWVELDGTSGITALPFDVLSRHEQEIAESIDSDSEDPEDLQAHFGDYYDGKVQSVSTRTGFGARLSAPGYMDCTEWSVFDTESEAQAWLEEMYGEDSEDSED